MREDGSDLREEASVPGQPSGLGWLPDGRLLVVSMVDRQVLRREPDGTMSVHADLSPDATGHTNDMVVDAQGRAYVGNFGFDLMAGDPIETAALHRVDPDGTVTEVADDLWFPNGCAITPTACWWSWRRSATGSPRSTSPTAVTSSTGGSGRSSARCPPISASPDPSHSCSVAPDGACLDAEGGLWIADAIGDRLIRVVEGGTITDVVDPGSPVYACGLGGSAGTTLFACAAPDFHEGPRKAASEARMLATQVAVPGA